jgi:hypothetical protein
MKPIREHPAYQSYLRALDADRRCRQAVATWEASGKPLVVEEYSQRWDVERARAFVRSLSGLFGEYNRVLWEQFPYCAGCRGQCCVDGGAFVATFDLLALALLNQPFPAIQDRILARDRDCIYRAPRGCSWPASWRTFKCWFFYCLGPEHKLRLEATVVGYRAIAEKLEAVTLVRLPAELHPFQAGLVAQLDNPLGFAESLGAALDSIFVGPFRSRYPAVADETRPAYYRGTHPSESILFGPGSVLDFVAQTLEQVYGSGIPAEQLLADLECLELIVLAGPAQAPRLVDEMISRYAPVPPPPDSEAASVAYRMWNQLSTLREQLYSSQRISILEKQ